MSVLNKVIHYQKKIERNKEHTETLIHCINKLHKLPITVRHLEKTGIGKTINELRKFDGDIGNAVKALVLKWKHVVFVETVAEERAKKERGLKNPIVSNSDESVLNDVKTGEVEDEPTHIKEDTTTLRNIARNDGTEMLQGIHEKGHFNSTKNLNCNDSEYESRHCDTLHQSTEGEDKAHSSTESHMFAINQSSPKSLKQKSSHRHHSSKHHTCNRKDKPKHDKKGKEVDRSELKIKKNDVKIKLDKELIKNENNKQEERKSSNFGSSSKHKHCSKRCESKTKYLESKERGQTRKTALNERYVENIPKQSKSSEKDKIGYDASIDYFGEALKMGDTVENRRSSSIITSLMRNSDSESSPDIKTATIPNSYIREIIHSTNPDLCLEDVKVKSLNEEIDLVSLLSETSPNYNKLPHLPLTVEAPALEYDSKQVPLSKQHRQRMKVYSGVKIGRPIPTLYDLSVHVLKEHIDALEYTGGVPYNILKPILQQATPEQLFQVEYYNPYLLEDTNELWEFHCRKEFRSGQLQSMETAREMYLRCLDEREVKLKALTCNIQQSLTKSIRTAKLAYVDSDPKPPQNVAKEQAKYATGRKSASFLTSTMAHSFLKKPINSTARTKPRFAPLMQKTMKLAKSLKR